MFTNTCDGSIQGIIHVETRKLKEIFLSQKKGTNSSIWATDLGMYNMPLEVLSFKFSLVEIKILKIIVIKFLNDCNSYGRGIYAFDVLPRLKHILRNQMAKCINITSPMTVAEHNILRKSVWTYD